MIKNLLDFLGDFFSISEINFSSDIENQFSFQFYLWVIDKIEKLIYCLQEHVHSKLTIFFLIMKMKVKYISTFL